MWKRIISIFEIPFDPLDEKSNQKQVVGSMIKMTALILLVFVISGLIKRGFSSPAINIASGMIFVLIIARFAINRWETDYISLFIVSAIWLFINVIFLFFENGLRSPIYMVCLIFLIVYVGLLHGSRALIVLTMLSILTGLTVGIMEWRGIFLTAPKVPNIFWSILTLLILFPFIALFVTKTLKNLKQSISLYRNEEQRFRILAEQSSDIILLINRKGIIIYENPAVEKILGLKSKERIGKNVLENLCPDDYNTVMNAFAVLLGDKNAPVQRGEIRIRHIDGSWRAFEVIANNLIKENVVDAIIINLRDITERKQAEETLKESENKYRLSFENVSDVIFMIDPDLNISSISPSVERILGYKPQDIIGWSVSDIGNIILTPESLKQTLTSISLVLKGETVSSSIYEFVAKDGTIKFGELSGSPVMEKGKIIGMISIARDITEHKRAEEALKQSESWYRTIYENTGTATVTIEEDTTISLTNTEFEKLSGYPKKEIEGRKHWEEFVVQEDLERMLTQHRLRREDAKSAQKNYEFRFVDKDGAIKDVVLSIDMIPGTKKSIASLLDITERKQGEEKLQHTLESLRKAVGTTIQVMVSAVEMRDPYTAGHQIRSAEIARAIAVEMGLDQNKIDGIQMAGSIHDIGKLSLPGEILSKPTKLTHLEFSLIKEHSRSGYEILKDVESPWPLAEIIYQHHELMNGTGYPRNLKGDEILIEARILAVADIVEAMASHRPYRASLGIKAALEEIEKNKGILYDTTVVDACLRLFREKGYQIT